MFIPHTSHTVTPNTYHSAPAWHIRTLRTPPYTSIHLRTPQWTSAHQSAHPGVHSLLYLLLESFMQSRVSLSYVIGYTSGHIRTHHDTSGHSVHLRTLPYTRVHLRIPPYTFHKCHFLNPRDESRCGASVDLAWASYEEMPFALGSIWISYFVCTCPDELLASKFQCHMNDAKCSLQLCQRRLERWRCPGSKGESRTFFSLVTQAFRTPCTSVTEDTSVHLSTPGVHSLLFLLLESFT